MNDGKRQARVERKTKETDVTIHLDVDGTGGAKVATPIPFFSHMLEAWSKHGLMDLTVEASGDVEVDIHHTVEDVGIVLGQALKQALTDKRGIVRYGTAYVPMDEALVAASVDISGRPFLVFNVPVARARVELRPRHAAGVLPRVRVQCGDHPARDDALRPQPPPHRGSRVQGGGARARGRHAAQPAHRGHPALDEGRAVAAP